MAETENEPGHFFTQLKYREVILSEADAKEYRVTE
jgi:hypothetical protein